MARVLCYTIMTACMRVIGKTISNKVQDMSNLQTDQYIRASMLMGNLKESGSIVGQTDNFIRENGSTDSNMVLECGRVARETAILESGG